MNAHFEELRSRVIRCLYVLGAAFIASYYFSNKLYDLISQPILKYLPIDTKIIATQVTAPFMVPMQLSFICALLFCTPYLLHQIWMFVKPGLYPQERKNLAPLIILSCGLFYIGLLFALFVICPVALKFFTNCGPDNVTIMLDIGSYLEFIITIAISCGIAFQIPIVTMLLMRCNILSKQQLRDKRRYVIVLAFIIGMLLAPPDVVSQLLLTIPMWGLFELGLVLGS